MHIDFDIHGLVSIRLVDPSPSDVSAVERQVGPFRTTLDRAPDLTLRYQAGLEIGNIRYAELGTNGAFGGDFYILEHSKRPVRMRLPFEELGKSHCEITLERNTGEVPFLMQLIIFTALAKDIVALHASAFTYLGRGILVTGWAKGGKSEALLAFEAEGARYVGDEWILLTPDGNMYGIPEAMRFWKWHLAERPELKRFVPLRRSTYLRLLVTVEQAARLIAKLGPRDFANRMLALVTRQQSVQLAPADILRCAEGFRSQADEVFLMLSQGLPEIEISRIDAAEVAEKMCASLEFEAMDFWSQYLAHCFCFPQRRNSFLETIAKRQAELLSRALAGRSCWVVRHPYPVRFAELFRAMRPYATGNRSREETAAA